MSILFWGEVSPLFKGLSEFKVVQAPSVPPNDLGWLVTRWQHHLRSLHEPVSFSVTYGEWHHPPSLVPSSVHEENGWSRISVWVVRDLCSVNVMGQHHYASTHDFITNICFMYIFKRNISVLCTMRVKTIIPKHAGIPRAAQ